MFIPFSTKWQCSPGSFLAALSLQGMWELESKSVVTLNPECGEKWGTWSADASG